MLLRYSKIIYGSAEEKLDRTQQLLDEIQRFVREKDVKTHIPPHEMPKDPYREHEDELGYEPTPDMPPNLRQQVEESAGEQQPKTQQYMEEADGGDRFDTSRIDTLSGDVDVFFLAQMIKQIDKLQTKIQKYMQGLSGKTDPTSQGLVEKLTGIQDKLKTLGKSLYHNMNYLGTLTKFQDKMDTGTDFTTMQGDSPKAPQGGRTKSTEGLYAPEDEAVLKKMLEEAGQAIDLAESEIDEYQVTHNNIKDLIKIDERGEEYLDGYIWKELPALFQLT